MTRQMTEFSLETRLGRFTGLAAREPGSPRLLCLHGWLDNAASFLPLAPLLEGLDVVALDLAGHGHSDPRPQRSQYHLIDNLWDLDAVLDALEWESCHLLGHSMGAAIAGFYAASAPSRVERMVLLDGIGPPASTPDQAVKRLRKSRISVLKHPRPVRAYDDVESAVQARLAASDLSPSAARLLCERALHRRDRQLQWRTDARLKWTTPVLLEESQVLVMLSAIEAPTLSILAEPRAEWLSAETAQKRFDALQDCRHISLPGHHHLHMETPEAVAGPVRSFLLYSET